MRTVADVSVQRDVCVLGCSSDSIGNASYAHEL